MPPEGQEVLAPQHTGEASLMPAEASTDTPTEGQEVRASQHMEETSPPLTKASADIPAEERGCQLVSKPAKTPSFRREAYMAPTWSWASSEGIVTLELLLENAIGASGQNRMCIRGHPEVISPLSGISKVHSKGKS